MGGAPGQAGEPSDGEDLQTHPIGDSVSDSRSVNRVSAKIDHFSNVPTFIFKSSLSSHAVRLAFPIWSLVEISRPRVQLSSCHTALVQGEGGARNSDASRKASFDARPPSVEQRGMCNCPIAAYILFLNVCQWILVAVLSVWPVCGPPQNLWIVGLPSQPDQRALITNSG